MERKPADIALEFLCATIREYAQNPENTEALMKKGEAQLAELFGVEDPLRLLVSGVVERLVDADVEKAAVNWATDTIVLRELLATELFRRALEGMLDKGPLNVGILVVQAFLAGATAKTLKPASNPEIVDLLAERDAKKSVRFINNFAAITSIGIQALTGPLADDAEADPAGKVILN